MLSGLFFVLYAKHTEFSLGKLNLKTHGQGMLGPKDLDINGLGLLERVNYFYRSLLLDMMGILKYYKIKLNTSFYSNISCFISNFNLINSLLYLKKKI